MIRLVLLSATFLDLKVCTLLNERCKRWNHHKGGKESLAVNIVGNTGNESNVSSLLSGSLTYIYVHTFLFKLHSVYFLLFLHSIVVCRCVASNDVFLPV